MSNKKQNTKLSLEKVLVGMNEYLIMPFFRASYLYKRFGIEDAEETKYKKEDLSVRLRYLKRMGYINVFVKNKEKFIEITGKGRDKILSATIDKVSIPKPVSWDHKWRVIIFDIPEKYKTERDLFRRIILKLGLIQIQKSVYVYPFQCTAEIKQVSENLNVSKFVTIMISEIIQGEEQIISSFLDKRILSVKNLKSK